MSYEYADRDRDKLTVVGVAGAAYVHAGHGSQEISVRVEAEDAPAVALAILEAADCGKAGKIRLSRAMIALVEHISAEKERAEREAEDPKVREFREASMSAIATVFNESNADSKGWDGLSEAGREGWRARYRAARKFFEES